MWSNWYDFYFYFPKIQYNIKYVMPKRGPPTHPPEKSLLWAPQNLRRNPMRSCGQGTGKGNTVHCFKNKTKKKRRADEKKTPPGHTAPSAAKPSDG